MIRIGALVVSLLALSAAKASAAPLAVRLDYLTGADCPDAADFKAVVIARLGYDPFSDGAADRVLVRIDARDRALDGRIEWRDASDHWTGEQAFPSVSSDCAHLVRAMGFALAVQIQLLAKANAAPDRSAAAATPTATAPDAATDRTPPRQPETVQPLKEPIVASPAAVGPPAGTPRPVFAMGAGPSVGLGLSSSPVLLGRLFGAVTWPHLSVELAAVVSLPATTRRSDGAGFSQQLLLGSAAGCATAVRWSACLLANVGAVRMAGVDIERPASASVPIVEAGARLAIRQDLGHRVFFSARADGVVNLIRWTGRLDGLPVWTAPRFSAAIGADAGVRFF